MIASPGLRFADHTVTVPLDHGDPDGATIEVFAREVVAADRGGQDLPWLLFLQGGPAARPGGRCGPRAGSAGPCGRTGFCCLISGERGAARP